MNTERRLTFPRKQNKFEKGGPDLNASKKTRDFPGREIYLRTFTDFHLTCLLARSLSRSLARHRWR